jgi:hypothetical protein
MCFGTLGKGYGMKWGGASYWEHIGNLRNIIGNIRLGTAWEDDENTNIYIFLIMIYKKNLINFFLIIISKIMIYLEKIV